MRIRRFRPEDAPAASQVINESFKTFLGDRVNPRKPLAPPRRLKQVSHARSYDGRMVSYVAVEDGRVIGYIRGSVKKCGLGSLEVVGVSPNAFSKGVGTALMKELEKFWRRHKMRKVYTCVSAHNTKALIYYIRNGFVPEGYQRNHFRDGVDEIMLGRFLKYK